MLSVLDKPLLDGLMQLNKQYYILNPSFLIIFFLKLSGSRKGFRLIDTPNY